MGVRTRKGRTQSIVEDPGSAIQPKQKTVGYDDAPAAPASVRIHAARSGQWIEAETLRCWAMEQIESRTDASPGIVPALTLDLSGLEHLDTSALQILLALDRKQRQRGSQLRLENPSQSLRRWFDYAGAGGLLGSTAPTGMRVAASGEDL